MKSSASTSPKGHLGSAPTWGWLLALGLAVLHCLWLWSNWVPAPADPDFDGYFIPARTLCQHLSLSRPLESPVQFHSRNWFPLTAGAPGETDAGTRLMSRYPPGMSLLIAPALKAGLLCSPSASPLAGVGLLNIIFSGLLILTTYALARCFMGNWVALLCALTLACSTVLQQHTLALNVHVTLALVLCSGLLCLIKLKNMPEKQEGYIVRLGLAGGLLLGYLPALHYAEGICMVMALIWALGSLRSRLKCFWLLIGTALPLLSLGTYNLLAFGTPWATAYHLDGEASAFGWHDMGSNLVNYLSQIGAYGLGPLLGVGLAGLAALTFSTELRKQQGRLHNGVLLMAVSLPLLLLYLSYYFHEPRAVQRFFLPLVPIFSLSAFWLLSCLISGSRERQAALTALCLTQLLFNGFFSWHEIREEHYELQQNQALISFCRQVPSASPLITDDLTGLYLDSLGEHKLASAQSLCLGSEEELRHNWQSLQKWSAGQPIYAICERKSFTSELPSWVRATPVSCLNVPCANVSGSPSGQYDLFSPPDADFVPLLNEQIPPQECFSKFTLYRITPTP